MKNLNITCAKCGSVTVYDPEHPQVTCAACGEKLTIDVA